MTFNYEGKRCEVRIPGDNSYTIDDLFIKMVSVPGNAKVRTVSTAGRDPDILIWWDEEL